MYVYARSVNLWINSFPLQNCKRFEMPLRASQATDAHSPRQVQAKIRMLPKTTCQKPALVAPPPSPKAHLTPPPPAPHLLLFRPV